MEKLVFADTFKKGVQGVIKLHTVAIDCPIFRLHYTATGFSLLFFSVLVSGYQFFGQPILCIQRDDIPTQLLNTYCWIEGTFTLPKALTKKVGEDVVYPGIEKYQKGDEVIEHAYYQWVCFMLLLQALMFCVPYVVWKALEGGRMKALVQKLKNPVLDEEERKSNYRNLANYFRSHREMHQQYALKFIFCEFLNFVNVVGQIYFIDKFLGGHFTKYGASVVSYYNEEQENREDPMIKVFPRVTKCTFHKYGSSGDVQKHDALCLLPLNILNEKIYIIMWFWFVILASLDGFLLLYRLFVFFSKKAQYQLLKCVSHLTPHNDIKSVIPAFSYGDWFMLYMLADNIDNIHFRAFFMELQGKDSNDFPRGVPRTFRSKTQKEKGSEEESVKLNNGESEA